MYFWNVLLFVLYSVIVLYCLFRFFPWGGGFFDTFDRPFVSHLREFDHLSNPHPLPTPPPPHGIYIDRCIRNLPLLFMFFKFNFPILSYKKRHSNKWCQAPFGSNDSLWAKSKRQAGKESGAGAETPSLPHPRSPHPTPSPHLFPKIFCLPVPSSADCGFVEICFTLVMTFLG